MEYKETYENKGMTFGWQPIECGGNNENKKMVFGSKTFRSQI